MTISSGMVLPIPAHVAIATTQGRRFGNNLFSELNVSAYRCDTKLIMHAARLYVVTFCLRGEKVRSSAFARQMTERRKDMATKQGHRGDHDQDSPEMTARDFARAKSLRKAMPEVVEVMKRGRGSPKLANPKARVSLRVDSDVIAAYRATGARWQKRVHETLARGAARLKPKRRGSRSA